MVFSFFILGDNGSSNLNVFETNKNLNTMENPWVVQIRLHILVVCLFRTTPSFIKDHQIFFCWKAVQLDNKMRFVAQFDHLVAQKNHHLLKPPNGWCEVCINT